MNGHCILLKPVAQDKTVRLLYGYACADILRIMITTLLLALLLTVVLVGFAFLYTQLRELKQGTAANTLLKDISDSHIENNKFIQNTVAIHMEGSSRIEIENNIFKGNGWALKVQASCDDNTFHHNNFFGNSFDIATNGSVTLNKFYNNYWDKYDGYDMNKDGIGDVPYHPVSLYSMIVEQNPNTLMLLRSFMVSLLDKAEKAIPSLTPENLIDEKPMIKPNKL